MSHHICQVNQDLNKRPCVCHAGKSSNCSQGTPSETRNHSQTSFSGRLLTNLQKRCYSSSVDFRYMFLSIYFSDSFHFPSLHVNTNIWTFYSLHVKIRLFTLVKMNLRGTIGYLYFASACISHFVAARDAFPTQNVSI